MCNITSTNFKTHYIKRLLPLQFPIQINAQKKRLEFLQDVISIHLLHIHLRPGFELHHKPLIISHDLLYQPPHQQLIILLTLSFNSRSLPISSVTLLHPLVISTIQKPERAFSQAIFYIINYFFPQ